MNTVNKKHRRAAASSSESDPVASPLEAALFTADEVGELVYTFSSECVVGGGGANMGAARQYDLAPAIVVILHRGGY